MKNSFLRCLLLCCLLSGCSSSKLAYRPPRIRPVSQLSLTVEHTPGVLGELVSAQKSWLLHDFIEQIEREKPHLQGGFIAILDRGQVVYETVFGHQAGDVGVITRKTLFSVASVSKLTAATAVALNVESGALDLNKCYKLPWLAHPVSLQHVLSHTTGYDFIAGNGYIEQGMSREAILAKLAETAPIGEPGTRYAYSNIIFSLVDDLLRLEDYSLRDSIANLGRVLATDGILLAPVPATVAVSHPHAIGQDGAKIALPLAPYYPYASPAAAGIYASLDGLIELYRLRFGYRPDLLSKETLDRFNSPVTRAQDFKKWNKHWPVSKRQIRSYYGLGCRILRSVQHPGFDLVYHTGFLNGVGAFMGCVPATGFGIIIVLNQQSRFTFEKGLDFWGLFLKKWRKYL